MSNSPKIVGRVSPLGRNPTSDCSAHGWLYRPSFPDEWERRSLLAMARWVNGLAFRDFQFTERGKPVIKIAEIKGGITGQTKFTNQSFDDSVFVTSGDMLFSWSGQPETSIDVFWWRGHDGWLNQHIFKVTPIDELDPMFFFYVLRYLKPNFIGIARNKQTTGLGHVTRRDIENIEAAFPPLAEQKAIAHILGTLDDKIELNRRMNATLEAMARALFQSWFVDFDPVRAKLDDRKPAGLDTATAELFPVHFQDSPLGHIPQGWEVGTLGNVTEVQGGFAFKSKDFIDSGIPVVKIKNIKDDHTVDVYDVEYVPTHLASQVKEYQLADGDVLMAMTGANVAKFGLLVNREVRAVLNQRVARFVPRSYLGRPWFVFCALLDESILNQIVSRAEGSAQPNVSATGIKAAQLIKPPEAIVDAFNEVVHQLFTSFLNNIRENRTLATLRDTLLPKLLSGELTIPEMLSKA